MKKYCSYLFLFTCILLSACSDPAGKPATAAPRQTVKYPEKEDMYLLTDRPPQLETPLKIFRQDITPNEYFFVRWHHAQIVTKIDIDTFRLYVGGAVTHPLALSMNDLRTRFPADSVIALAVCAGNSRSTFQPRVPGSQWGNGAMGNAVWKGVKLSHILEMAGVPKDAVDVTFEGMDRPVLPATPSFAKSLSIGRAMDGEVLVAYEMNGKPIPMLNGYPLKLVVPGWYATYWVGSLNKVAVLTDTFHGYWMAKAYQATKDPNLDERPDSIAKTTAPLTRINLHSIFVQPEPGDKIHAGKACTVEGLAFDDGTGIHKVELSLDDGKTWVETKLNPVLGKYSWRRWNYDWTPKEKGMMKLCVRATDNSGKTQPDRQWNRSGYARGFIERIEVTID